MYTVLDTCLRAFGDSVSSSVTWWIQVIYTWSIAGQVEKTVCVAVWYRRLVQAQDNRHTSSILAFLSHIFCFVLF